MDENTVYLNTAAYNGMKAESIKANMFIDRIMQFAELDGEDLTIDSRKLFEIFEIIYPNRYAKEVEKRKETMEDA